MTSNNLSTLLAEATSAAARLQRRLHFADRDDLQQDLLLDLLQRLPAYDPGWGPIGPFAGAVLRNRSALLTARAVRIFRRQGGSLLSLEARPTEYAERPIAETLGESAGLWTGQTGSAGEASDRELSVASVLGSLGEADRRLCALLAENSATELVRSGACSRSHLYRQIARLRRAFAACGLGTPALT